jgi:SAM-dependent methyltransferase
VRADRRNARHRVHWASVLEQLAQYAAAAEQLTEALHLDPGLVDAADRLSLLLSRRGVPPSAKLNPVGVSAALGHAGVAGQVICDAAASYLASRGGMRRAIDAGRRSGWLHAARNLVLEKTSASLRDPLLHGVLGKGVLRNLDLERLLTALRRVLLLELPPPRLEDRDLAQLCVVMLQQCHANEHVWAVSAEEAAVVEAPFRLGDLSPGSGASGARLLVRAMYKGVGAICGDPAAERVLAEMRTPEMRSAVDALLADVRDLRTRATKVPRLGRIVDETSRKVALQYEQSPYPRWLQAYAPPPGEMRKLLGEFFKPAELGFLDQEFEVLMAGCGTGRQAVVTALALPNAKVTGVDLSAMSLAYASRMAERMEAKNLAFVQADIMALPSVAPHLRQRFKIIACSGVLHHMADPFEGWRRVLECLAPGGLMLVGLYSRTARRELAALRTDRAYPGPGCSDRELREFRRVVMDRGPGETGSGLRHLADFYTLSEFRDLVCHVEEHQMTLPAIRDFLIRNRLGFRGFWLAPSWIDQFRKAYPEEAWPGRLEVWERFEAAHPSAFLDMYHFWCSNAQS